MVQLLHEIHVDIRCRVNARGYIIIEWTSVSGATENGSQLVGTFILSLINTLPERVVRLRRVMNVWHKRVRQRPKDI